MRLHLVRHGETRHNVEGRIQGDHIDDDLNENGYAQAEALGRYYTRERVRGLTVSAVYSSPLKRARSTGAKIAEALDLPSPAILHGAREVSWGHHMGKLNEGSTLDDMARVLNAWDKGDLGAHVEGGETPAQAWARAIHGITPLVEMHRRDDIVLVAHGRINKIITSGLLHGHLRHMDHYPQANASITLLEGPDPWRLVAPNRTRHLEGIRALDERVS